MVSCVRGPARAAIEITPTDESRHSDVPPETPSMECVLQLDKMIGDTIYKVDVVRRCCCRDKDHQKTQIHAAAAAMEKVFNYALDHFREATRWIPDYELKQARADLNYLEKASRAPYFMFGSCSTALSISGILNRLKSWKEVVVPKQKCEEEVLSKPDEKEEVKESLINENAALKKKVRLLDGRVSRLEKRVKRLQAAVRHFLRRAKKF